MSSLFDHTMEPYKKEKKKKDTSPVKTAWFHCDLTIMLLNLYVWLTGADFPCRNVSFAVVSMLWYAVTYTCMHACTKPSPWNIYTLMAYHKTTGSPLLMHWRYYSLALSHQYVQKLVQLEHICNWIISLLHENKHGLHLIHPLLCKLIAWLQVVPLMACLSAEGLVGLLLW